MSFKDWLSRRKASKAEPAPEPVKLSEILALLNKELEPIKKNHLLADETLLDATLEAAKKAYETALATERPRMPESGPKTSHAEGVPLKALFRDVAEVSRHTQELMDSTFIEMLSHRAVYVFGLNEEQRVVYRDHLKEAWAENSVMANSADEYFTQNLHDINFAMFKAMKDNPPAHLDFIRGMQDYEIHDLVTQLGKQDNPGDTVPVDAQNNFIKSETNRKNAELADVNNKFGDLYDQLVQDPKTGSDIPAAAGYKALARDEKTREFVQARCANTLVLASRQVLAFTSEVLNAYSRAKAEKGG